MEKTFDLCVKKASKNIEIIETLIVATLSFLVPIFLAKLLNLIFGSSSVIVQNSQIVVGSVVNTLLVLAAINLKGVSNIFIITMPSVSTILSGYVFKYASVFMVYMIPAIWLGNFILMFTFKYLLIKRKQNYFLVSVVAIALKVLVIFSGFSLLKALAVFPQKIVSNLQNAMGLIQIITATIGCTIAFVVYLLEIKKEKKNS